LFNIPQEIPIAVTYTDEEGDIITLSSDLELQEVLSNPSNKTIKFILKTSNGKNLQNTFIDRERSIDTIIDEETSSLINGVSAIQIEESNNHNHKHETVSGYKHVHITMTDDVDNQETPGETSKKAAESTNNNRIQEENQESSNSEPEIIVIITRNRRHHQGFGRHHPYRNFGRGFRHESSSQQGCNTASRGCGYRGRQKISSEVLAEKINLLHSMGFFNDNLEELIKKYNGNLEHIIEVLLFNQQNEQSEEKNKEKEVREENGEQSMEVEENLPYDL